MTSSIAAASAEGVSSARVIEKEPLERYVAPARPSLVGLPRTDLAAALGGIGVAPQQQRMRVQQIWQWLYVRGAQILRQRGHGVEALRAAHVQPCQICCTRMRCCGGATPMPPSAAARSGRGSPTSDGRPGAT